MSLEPEAHSEEAAIANLMNIIPEDSYTIASPGPAEEKPAEQKTEQPEDKQADGAQEVKPVEPEEDVEIEYEGDRYKVPAKLKSAIMMEVDYRKKTMELAVQRKELEQGRADPKALEEYKQKISVYENILGDKVAEDQAKDWVRLLDTDPVEYLRQKEMAEARAREWSQVNTRRQNEHAESTRQAMIQEAQQLVAKRPEWKDAAVFQADVEKMKPSLVAIGYTPEEITAVTDHRAFILAEKAFKYDQLMAAKTEVVKKIEKLPPKVERPGVASAEEGQSNKEALSRLRKTGHIDDAASAIRSLMQ